MQTHCSSSEIKAQSPGPVERMPGSRKLTKAQLKGLQAAHKLHVIPDRGGLSETRAAEDWVRPGYRTQCPKLRGNELISAVIYMAFRQGKLWNTSETMIMSDLEARSFGADYIARCNTRYAPKWLERVAKALHSGRLPYKSGYLDFIGDVLRAKRVGAVSVYISQVEAGKLYGCDERTFRRWIVSAEDLGVISMLQTWARNNGVRRNAHRRWAKIAYTAGPALVEAVGLAIYEGVGADKLRGGERTVIVARKDAQKLRASCLAEFREARDDAWRAKYAKPKPTTLSPDILPSSPSPKGSEIGFESRSGQIKERPTAAVLPATPDARGVIKLNAPRDVASHAPSKESSSPVTTPPARAESRLAPKAVVGVSSADEPTLLELALSRMRGESKRFRGGLHALVFMLMVALTACGGDVTDTELAYGHDCVKNGSDGETTTATQAFLATRPANLPDRAFADRMHAGCERSYSRIRRDGPSGANGNIELRYRNRTCQPVGVCQRRHFDDRPEFGRLVARKRVG